MANNAVERPQAPTQESKAESVLAADWWEARSDQDLVMDGADIPAQVQIYWRQSKADLGRVESHAV